MRNLRRGKKQRRAKGGLMFEFALLLPLVMLLVAFTIDMGRLVSLSSTLHDATSVSARQGARVGYAGHIPGGKLCVGTPTSGVQPSYEAFCEAFRPLDGAELLTLDITTPTADGVDRWCNSNNKLNLYVTITATAKLNFITPGIDWIVSAANGGSHVRSVGVARCELAR